MPIEFAENMLATAFVLEVHCKRSGNPWTITKNKKHGDFESVFAAFGSDSDAKFMTNAIVPV